MASYNIKHIKNNPSSEGMADFLPDIVFSHAGGEEIKLSLMLPRFAEGSTVRKKCPTLVFLQGSGWQAPNITYQVPQMGEFARKGWAVAQITHRNAHAPAFLIDSKCAVRFLRAHAEEYGIDRDKIVFWGTSSGGNTALLMALTADEMQYKTEEYPEESDGVCGVIDCFGPTDIMALARFHGSEDRLDRMLPDGCHDREGFMNTMSPLKLIKGGRKLPPFLILQGDADPVVPYEQSEWMLKALTDAGHDARMVVVDGAPHEGSFWSREVFEICEEFMREVIL